MKTLRISDDSHRKLTAALNTLMAQTGKMQTYQDAIKALLNQSVKITPELLAEIEDFVKENKRLGYTTKEEFIREAIRFKLKMLKGKKEYIEISKQNYDKLNKTLKETNMPCHNAHEI